MAPRPRLLPLPPQIPVKRARGGGGAQRRATGAHEQSLVSFIPPPATATRVISRFTRNLPGRRPREGRRPPWDSAPAQAREGEAQRRRWESRDRLGPTMVAGRPDRVRNPNRNRGGRWKTRKKRTKRARKASAQRRLALSNARGEGEERSGGRVQAKSREFHSSCD